MSNEYPAFFFHQHHGRKKVASQAERDALGPEWSDSPATVTETLAAAHANGHDPVPPVSDPAPVDPVDPPTPQDDPGMPLTPVDAATAEEQEKQAVWGSPVGILVESLAEAPRDVLERVLAFEQQNPKGARVTVVRAIDKALEALPVEAGETPDGAPTQF